MSKENLPAVPEGMTREDARDEAQIEKHLGAFVEVGRRLREIKKRGNYKQHYGSWPKYLEDRWEPQIKRRYADYLIDAADSVDAIGSGTNVPVSEGQVRPLTKLDTPEQKATAWERAVAHAAKPNQPTAKEVEAAVEQVRYVPVNAETGEVIEAPPEPPKQDIPPVAYRRVNWSLGKFTSPEFRALPNEMDRTIRELEACIAAVEKYGGPLQDGASEAVEAYKAEIGPKLGEVYDLLDDLLEMTQKHNTYTTPRED